MQKYGDKAKINIVPNTRTKISYLIPDEITVEFIQHVRYAAIMKQIVKKMGWGGGKNGYFSVRHITPKTLENDKKKAINLLNGIIS